MPKKGKSSKKTVEISWDENECCGGKSWKKWMFKRRDSSDNGFFGRALFAIGVLIALNATGVFQGMPQWLPWLIGIGFALMRF